MSDGNIHWEWRYPRLAIASFWIRAVVGWALWVALFFPWIGINLAMGFAAWLKQDHSPWKLTSVVNHPALKDEACKS